MLNERTELQIIEDREKFKKIAFESQGNTLVANVLLPHNENIYRDGIFFIHGGISGKGIALGLQKYLREQNYPSFAYDSTGVGESEGVFEEQTLTNRVDDAQRAFEIFQKIVQPSCIVALSMGADTALYLLEQYAIESLILLGPAAYHDAVREQPLTRGDFTRQLRMDKSWKTGISSFALLERFLGSALIIYGEKDLTIPRGIQRRFERAIEGKGEYLIIPEANHNLLKSNSQTERQVFISITEFLSRHKMR
ncbi:hypothetical protein A2966_02595 [Candidatus Roizmanbacteria bacterium RIFCSPLOWO2_01_FULL_41_22]|uniref:Serine aminopeptidase S33 domain-containing protein n=1 Tax=Candidatus Roizmanbacteria bacterium RIFCSPLOWO2_01_FULL_41_22 TaxID=1802067 RepID=A0A1F7J8T9_9BACT|nr:MAG: hypothetical protein A2966_02595 [Candidatus Roizmanbacteria bacterium RIFCSPLOWO2_01_FULL_41_22]